MRNSLISLLSFLLATVAVAAEQPALDSVKQAAIVEVVQQEAQLVELSDAVWGFAETALAETQSAQVLADYAEEQGFRVTRGVGDMPTAFIAEYGSGKPIIGILGEYDALPRLSQAAIPEHQPLQQYQNLLSIDLQHLQPSQLLMNHMNIQLSTEYLKNQLVHF